MQSGLNFDRRGYVKHETKNLPRQWQSGCFGVEILSYILGAGAFTITSSYLKSTAFPSSGDSLIEIDNSGSNTVFRARERCLVNLNWNVFSSTGSIAASTFINGINYSGTSQPVSQRSLSSVSAILEVGDSVKLHAPNASSANGL